MAETAFGFLAPLGFTLNERWVTGGASFRDGWRLTFSSPKVQVVVQYMDMQFEVHFVRGGITISYLQLDRDLFGRRSGFHGDMFPLQKLEVAIQRIAEDISTNYREILLSDDSEWLKIARLKAEAPKTRRLP